VWEKLAEATLCRIVIFNKLRGGEASKLLVKNYQERPNWNELNQQDILSSLKPIEKELSKR
jgi:hypothetical protein